MQGVRLFVSGMVLAVGSTFAPGVYADSPPGSPAPAPAGPGERAVKRIVLLYNGSKYCGLQQAVAGSQVALKLATGELKHFSSDEVMRVTPASSADAVGASGNTNTAIDRMIVLHDGTMLRGELVEHVPKDHLTLLLASGLVRRFEQSQLNQVLPIVPIAGAAPLPSSQRAKLKHREVEYAGAVVEYLPKKSISLRLEGGEIRSFPWSEVQPIADFVPIRALGFAEQISAQQLSAGRVFVSVVTSAPVVWLVREIPDDEAEKGAAQFSLGHIQISLTSWKCRAPCNRWLDKDALRYYYVIKGDDIEDSQRFRLWEGTPAQTIHVAVDRAAQTTRARIEPSPVPSGDQLPPTGQLVDR